MSLSLQTVDRSKPVNNKSSPAKRLPLIIVFSDEHPKNYNKTISNSEKRVSFDSEPDYLEQKSLNKRPITKKFERPRTSGHRRENSEKMELANRPYSANNQTSIVKKRNAVTLSATEAVAFGKGHFPPKINEKFSHLKTFQIDHTGNKYIGILIVDLIAAHDLANSLLKSSQKGIADPYCILTLGNQVENSKIVDNDLNPSWNQTILLCWDGISELIINIYDFDPRLYNEESMGHYKINIDSLNVGETSYHDGYLLGANKGRIELNLTLKVMPK